MTIVSGHPLRTYTLLVGAGLGTTIVLAGLGYWPTIRIAGGQAVKPMLAGCLVSWISSCVGAIPLARGLAAGGTQPALAILYSTAFRFVTVLLLVVPLVLGSGLDRTAIVVWVALSYLVLLLVDTVFVVRMVGHR